MLHIPFGCQRRERLGLLAPMDLRFDPARTAIGSRRAIRPCLRLITHPCGSSIIKKPALDSPYHAWTVMFKHRDFMGFA